MPELSLLLSRFEVTALKRCHEGRGEPRAARGGVARLRVCPLNVVEPRDSRLRQRVGLAGIGANRFAGLFQCWQRFTRCAS